jgi:hypothetical protein
MSCLPFDLQGRLSKTITESSAASAAFVQCTFTAMYCLAFRSSSRAALEQIDASHQLVQLPLEWIDDPPSIALRSAIVR